MENQTSLKPIHRSKIRVFLGINYYRFKRYVEWFMGKTRFAKTKLKEELPFSTVAHKTPLLRKLKNVNMWLQYNKVINLRIATKKLNGIIIRPGETFSYWRLIGKTTRRKGYVDGMVLHYGKVKTGVGGGLCQLSNLIYWMTLHTPLTITERYRHSYDVFPDSNRTQPFGSGATCYYNYLDLQIKNDTPQSYQLFVNLTDKHLVGEWKCDYPSTRKYEIYEKDHQISMAYWGGYIRQNTLFRKVFNLENTLIDDEYVTENQAIMMYEPLLSTEKAEGNI